MIPTMSVYDFQATTIDGEVRALSDYRGQVLLIVNTASKCGFTPQYAQLEELYQKYREQGFQVLGFPCNQFLEQEPEDNPKIKEFCQLNYQVSFPLFAKLEINGPGAAPLFTFLKEHFPFQGFDQSHPLGVKLDEILSAQDGDYARGNDIKWNFTKFLVDRTGEVVQRFEPTAPLGDIEEAVARLLK